VADPVLFCHEVRRLSDLQPVHRYPTWRRSGSSACRR